jgi:hypothetical protein
MDPIRLFFPDTTEVLDALRSPPVLPATIVSMRVAVPLASSSRPAA